MKNKDVIYKYLTVISLVPILKLILFTIQHYIASKLPNNYY